MVVGRKRLAGARRRPAAGGRRRRTPRRSPPEGADQNGSRAFPTLRALTRRWRASALSRSAGVGSTIARLGGSAHTSPTGARPILDRPRRSSTHHALWPYHG